jgi:glycosyltransferase involved in cell wall biosynthesis
MFEGLHAALVRPGVAVERIHMASDERDFDRVLRSYLRFYDADLSAFDGVISTKSPSYAVRHRNHVCYLMHTMRIFYDMSGATPSDLAPTRLAQCDIVHQIDTAALSRPSVRAVFVVGAEVRERLRAFNRIDSEVLHHPSTLQPLRAGKFRYLLLPGRLHPWKRVDLALDAVRRMRHSVDLIICGTGEDESRLRALACGMARVRFTGHVPDVELARIYADALAVLYCPIREDYGLVPVEAFMSGKPVVTCHDSGEPARLVSDGITGFVCASDAESIADRLDWLAENRTLAEAMGHRGRESVEHVNWDGVCNRLLGALGCSGQVR